MLFQVCSPMKLCSRSSASASVKPAVRDGRAVGVADHVVMEDDAAHPGQHARSWPAGIAGAVDRLLGRRIDRLFVAFVAGVVQAAVGPVAVRAEHGRQLAGRRSRRPVQVAGDVMARMLAKKTFSIV